MATPCEVLAEGEGNGAATGRAVLNQICVECHPRLPDGGWQEISEAAPRSFGAWQNVLMRMETEYGAELNQTDKTAAVEFLASHIGLKPIEAAEGELANED